MSIHKQKGFSLIEALVAFLIVSVGMLGIASLQALSLKAGHTAGIRTVAVIKAQEILERMRSNALALESYAVGAGGAGVNTGCNDLPAVKICTPLVLAADDVFYWKSDITSSLPASSSPTASVVIIAPTLAQPLSQVTVTINWQERNTEAQVLDNMNYTTTAMVCDATPPAGIPAC